MAGTKVHNGNHEVHVGHEADVSVFSFQVVKNLLTADSGMICFKSKKLDYYRENILKNNKDTFSRTAPKVIISEVQVPQVGYKYYNSIMASIAKVQLKYLDEDNFRRNEIGTYDKEISQILY